MDVEAVPAESCTWRLEIFRTTIVFTRTRSRSRPSSGSGCARRASRRRTGPAPRADAEGARQAGVLARVHEDQEDQDDGEQTWTTNRMVSMGSDYRHASCIRRRGRGRREPRRARAGSRPPRRAAGGRARGGPRRRACRCAGPSRRRGSRGTSPPCAPRARRRGRRARRARSRTPLAQRPRRRDDGRQHGEDDQQGEDVHASGSSGDVGVNRERRRARLGRRTARRRQPFAFEDAAWRSASAVSRPTSPRDPRLRAGELLRDARRVARRDARGAAPGGPATARSGRRGRR